MLQISHLTIDHQHDLRTLVHDLSISISPGDKVAIIGEEGNGKSSLLKLIMDPKLVQDYLQFDGQITRHYSSHTYIPQSLPLEIAELTLNDYFFGDFDEPIDYSLLYLYADQLQFDSDRFTSPQVISSLSGGEKLKIQLIKLLAQDSQILFLDEPSNDLDLDTLIWLENFIAQSTKTILFVSHDEDLLATTATKIIHLESVKKKTLAQTSVKTNDYQTYRDNREQAYQKQVQQARNDRKEFDKAMTKHLRQKSQVRDTLLNTHDSTMGRLVAKKMKGVLSREKRYERMKENLTQVPYHEDAIDLFFSDLPSLPATKVVLDVDDFQLRLEEKVLASHLTLRVKGREKIGIIGPNGCGKSSFLKELCTLLSSRKDLSLGYMPQHYADVLDDKMSPLEFLLAEAGQAYRQKILTHLASLQFTRQEVHHPMKDLSGGQRAKILILKMVLEQANFLLLDEPSRNFSPTSQPYIRQLFADYAGGLICVSHDRRFLKEVCQTVYRLTEKGLVEVDKIQL